MEYLLVDGSPRRFLQLGAHDGQSSDFCMARAIRDGWIGTMVEANPPIYAKLEQAIESRGLARVQALHCAVTEAFEPGPIEFWRVHAPERTKHPEWASQASSLSRSKIVSELIDWGHSTVEAEDLVEAISISCRPIQNLATQCEPLDLIVSDLEGMDWNILRGLRWEEKPCQVLKMETAHHDHHVIGEAISRLSLSGYSILRFRWDLIAWHNRYTPARQVDVR